MKDNNQVLIGLKKGIVLRVKNFIKEDGVYLALTLLLYLISITIIAVSNCYETSKLVSFSTDSYGIITFCITTLFGIIYFFILKNIDKKNIDLSKIFLIIAIPIGVLYCIFNPLGKIPDERSHGARAYEISQGYLLSQVNENGDSVRNFNDSLRVIMDPEINSYSEYLNNLFLGDSDIESELLFSNTALYSPICYLPQAICIFIFRFFHANIAIQLLAGRIGNFLVAMILIYFAIKKIPFKKIIVLLIALLPIALNEFSSLSSDCLTNAITIFFISYILYLRFDKDSIVDKKTIAIITISGITLSLCKIVYIPICLLLFLIPNEKFRNKKDKYLKVGIIFASVLVLNLIWLGIATKYLVTINPGANSDEQTKYILSNPINFCIIFARTMYVNFQTYVECIFGQGLGALNIGISSIYEYPLIILFSIMFLFNENNEVKNDKKLKIFMTIILFGIIALIFTSLYIQWTPLYNSIILRCSIKIFYTNIIINSIYIK